MSNSSCEGHPNPVHNQQRPASPPPSLMYIFYVFRYWQGSAYLTWRNNCLFKNVNIFSRHLQRIDLMIGFTLYLPHFRGLTACGPLLLTGVNIIPEWITNCIHYKMWGEITYSSRNFNGATVDVWDWIINFIPQFTRLLIHAVRQNVRAYGTYNVGYTSSFLP